jgi:hypothetical protein
MKVARLAGERAKRADEKTADHADTASFNVLVPIAIAAMTAMSAITVAEAKIDARCAVAIIVRAAARNSIAVSLVTM